MSADGFLLALILAANNHWILKAKYSFSLPTSIMSIWIDCRITLFSAYDNLRVGSNNKDFTMQNDLTKKYYSFFISFNPFQRENGWENIADKAQSFYVNFLNEHDYGDNLMSTTFNFLVEKEIDFNRQDDYISTSSYLGIPKTARLTLHFEYNYFQNCDDANKYILTLNGILFLLHHWNDNLKIPKGNPLTEIIKDFTELLKNEKYLLGHEIKSKAFVKLTNPFRFTFIQHHFQGIKEKEILFNTNQIERFLNNHLRIADFGKSINRVYFSYDFFNFESKVAKTYIDHEKKYQYGKDKDFSFMEQYDSQLFLNKTKYEQVAYLHKGLLNAILRIKEMKRKPKDFDVDIFYNEINRLLTDYEENYCR